MTNRAMTVDNLILHQQVANFLALEARLLDDRAFTDWLELFEEDGIYWVPTSHNQTDMKGQVSVMLEDKPLLALRVARLGHPRAYAIEPHPATTHMTGNITVTQDEDNIIAQSKLIVEELREGKSTRWSGSVIHHLRRREDSFGILLKRIDLIQAGSTYTAISVPF